MANSVIFINAEKKMFDFFSFEGRGKSNISTEHIPFETRAFDSAFFDSLPSALNKLTSKYPAFSADGVTFMLPDCAYANDLITIPVIKGGNMKKTMTATTDALFLNRDEVCIYSETMAQTKQFITTGYYYVQRDMLNRLRNAGNESKIAVKGIVPVNGALISAVNSFIPKLKSSTYLLLDIKTDMARIVFVNKGRAVCSSVLPFGFSMLSREEIPDEGLLIDHRIASDEVTAARRRARMKQKLFDISDEEEYEDDDFSDHETEDDIIQPEKEVQYLREDTRISAPDQITPEQARVRRRLPKYMLREKPETEEGFVYESFRIFMKWVLGAISANDKVSVIGDAEAVYVNLPREYDFLYDMINKEHRENGIKFFPLKIQEDETAFARNLEFYGAFNRGTIFGSIDSF